ncbi:MAG: acyl-CoA dehydrogenase family protein [Gemmatimonadaceae bacterium]
MVLRRQPGRSYLIGMTFFQQPPILGNQYRDDDALRLALRWMLPPDVLADVAPGLDALGARAVGDIMAAGDEAEAMPPRHVPYDAWGNRVDRIDVADGWRRLERIAVEEGLVALAYERTHGPWSRVHQMARLYLYAPSSAIFSCPLAMSDGAARALELHGDETLRAGPLGRLVARDPELSWTSGQWMTERAGGSDVSRTETEARCVDGTWRLHGTKWFTSATTSQMALTLARPTGAEAGSRGLSLFLVVLRDGAGALRGIRVNRMKEKLGTRALPTAELELDGAPAALVGGEGNGVRKIASMFNITRIHNAINAAAMMRRAVALAGDYAARRVAFGRPIADHPLHAATLATLRAASAGALLLGLRVAELLGREECGVATDDELMLLRLLTPVAKLYTAKQAVAVTSEAVEAFGGAGYIEDTGMPRLLRDAQVLPIWEGTTNVLSLDLLRAMAAGSGLAPLVAEVRRRLDGARAVEGSALASLVTSLREDATALEEWEGRLAPAGRDAVEMEARSLAYAVARLYTGALLVDQAAWASASGLGDAPLDAARHWVYGRGVVGVV